MTVCNMSIEAGARAGLIAPDDDDVRVPRGPPRRAEAPFGAAVERWRALRDRRRRGASTARSSIDAAALAPQVTWGTNPGQVAPITGRADPGASTPDDRRRRAALDYMGLTAGTPLAEIAVDRVFIGSCTNGRHRGPARRRRAWSSGRKVADGVRAMVVPGLDAGQGRRPRPRASTGSSATPASSGATPAAACASA